MGIKFSVIRKKKNLAEQLENIEAEIKELEIYSADTAERHRKITQQLMIYSSGFCIVVSVLLYFYFPLKIQNNLTLASGLVFFPVLYYATNHLISLHYNKKIRSSQTKLKDLKNEKKRLIDDIMNNETYKVAKDILEKYAPEALPAKYCPPASQIIRQVPPNNLNRTNLNQNPINRILPNVLNNRQTSLQSFSDVTRPIQVPPVLIFPQSKSYVERVFEYLIGEGPSSKYALICSSCKTHNGMALMEEFEYTAFKCYSCKFLNPARKQRPIAPKLESEKSDLEDQHIDEDKSGTDKDITGDLNMPESELDKEGESSLRDDEENEASSLSLGNNLCVSLSNEGNSHGHETNDEDYAKGTSSNSEEILSESNLDESSHLLGSSQINSVSVTN